MKNDVGIQCIISEFQLNWTVVRDMVNGEVYKSPREKEYKMRYTVNYNFSKKNYYDNRCRNCFAWRCYWEDKTL